MKNQIKVNVEEYGKVLLIANGDHYDVTNENGNALGEIYPEDFEDWDETDTHILGSILEDCFDDGTLQSFETSFEEEYEYDYDE